MAILILIGLLIKFLLIGAVLWAVFAVIMLVISIIAKILKIF